MSTLLNASRLHIEISSKCTVKCPRCPRTELRPDSLNKEITLEEFVRAFDSNILNSIDSISFCGDIGDPTYAQDFLEICEYIKSVSKTSLRITTNGSYKSREWWQRLGQILTDHDLVTFSVDGWDQASNEQYRVNSNFASILVGMTTLRTVSDCIMRWSAIYFKFNQDRMDKIQTMAKDIGFDVFHAVRSSKFNGRYNINGIDLLKPAEDFVASTAQYEQQVIKFTNKSEKSIITKQAHDWARCLNWQKELFISVDGLVFPCAWFNSGYQTNDFVQKYSDQINIKTRSLNSILADPLWNELVSRLDANPLDVCRIKCKNG
jgi:MoaA/NifB/PqqE/SkfB family radical SAM enzyme